MIIASSSPTIIQKESTDSVVSTPGGAMGSPAPPQPVASPIMMQQQQQQQQETVSPAAGVAAAAADQSADSPAVINYQSQYNLSTDRAHPLAAYLSAAAKIVRPDHTIAVVAAAAAAAEPNSTTNQQLPTLATQLPANATSGRQQADGQAAAGGGGGSHAPLNSSSTIRSASSANQTSGGGAGGSPKKTPTTTTTADTTATVSQSVVERRNEIIRANELLLNALNQGDYETYTQLCDPHMTSFEPENLGNLIDNMEYRRLCLDQARQLQLQHLKDSRASVTQQHQPTTATRQYSIILNPSVYLLGEDAASIAYTKLSQLMNLSGGGGGGNQLFSIEKSEETRIWHRKNGTKWLCVHLHRSIVDTTNKQSSAGPQTSATLVRCMANQHELESLLASSNQAPTVAAGASVPVISLNK